MTVKAKSMLTTIHCLLYFTNTYAELCHFICHNAKVRYFWLNAYFYTMSGKWGVIFIQANTNTVDIFVYFSRFRSKSLADGMNRQQCINIAVFRRYGGIVAYLVTPHLTNYYRPVS